MTHTPREQVPPAAESDKPIGIPDIRPRLKPVGEASEKTISINSFRAVAKCSFSLHVASSPPLMRPRMAVRNCHRTASRDPPTLPKRWRLQELACPNPHRRGDPPAPQEGKQVDRLSKACLRTAITSSIVQGHRPHGPKSGRRLQPCRAIFTIFPTSHDPSS